MIAAMLTEYFSKLISKVEASDTVVTNAGKDKDGFYKPTRTILLAHLHKLRDLHDKPRAKPMMVDAWKFVVANVPPEWLVLSDTEKAELKRMLE